MPYKCECCCYESNKTSKRTVGNIFSGTFMWVKSCKKCNWFLFENEDHKQLVLKLWNNNM